MNKLQLPQAKLLWAVSQAYRQRRIDQTEKRLLKEKIITDNIEIFQILEESQEESEVLDKLVALIRVPEGPAEVPQKDTDAIAATEQEEASSPWGEFLRRKKMNRQHEHKNEAKNIMGLIKKTE